MTFTATEIRERLGRLPRLNLAVLPTPLEPLPRLSAELGPRLFVKREDLTGLAMGGNKIREFEYSLAQAVEQGCDVLLHGAAAQSNQSRQTAAAAARLGMRSVVVGRRDAHAHSQGNLLLSRLFGAEVFLEPPDSQTAAIAARMEELRAAGNRPFNTSTDGCTYRGIAYVDGFLELWEQLQSREVRPDAIYVCSGAHTHTGMVVASKALGLGLRIVGISSAPRDDAEAARRMAALAAEQARILDLDLEFEPAEFESYAEFVGPDYGVVTEEARDAIRQVARAEGLLLDPSYTGKTMAGLIAHVARGWWSREHTLVFVHTGGTPALFAYSEELGLDGAV
jgi:1-aminocyclopropane-1-carboxylate deaminase/D-cysteine desulfhydrase-like pyridoxal-dependent ACC family enzyme